MVAVLKKAGRLNIFRLNISVMLQMEKKMEENNEMFQKTWPKALQKLKELAEK
jgi:hypothetical protein